MWLIWANKYSGDQRYVCTYFHFSGQICCHFSGQIYVRVFTSLVKYMTVLSLLWSNTCTCFTYLVNICKSFHFSGQIYVCVFTSLIKYLNVLSLPGQIYIRMYVLSLLGQMYAYVSLPNNRCTGTCFHFLVKYMFRAFPFWSNICMSFHFLAKYIYVLSLLGQLYCMCVLSLPGQVDVRASLPF
jgi:hypothetical protein